MLRQNHIEGPLGGPGKIRKRGCSSSSSSSSILQNYRFKRAILVGKRGGSSTPVPTWRLSSRSPYSSLRIVASPKYPPSQSGGTKGKQVPVSARKLAATLWEMNEIPSPRLKEDFEGKRIKKEMRSGCGSRDRITRSVQSGSLPPHLSDPSYSPISERMDRSVTSSIRRRTSAISQRLRLTDHNGEGFDSLSSASLMEIEMRSQGPTPKGSVVGVRTRLKDLCNGLTTSKELLKILNRLWGHKEQHSSSLSLISALHSELERAHQLVDQLIREKRSDKYEIDYLMKRFSDEMAIWKSKEKDRIRAAVDTIAGDLEVERKLRKRSDSLNKRLGIELAETQAVLSNTIKDLESEKTAKQLMKQVCEKLARGVGSQNCGSQGEVITHLSKTLVVSDHNEEKGEDEGQGGIEDGEEHEQEVDPEEDSAESDLHSIELNMDNNNNNNRSYTWQYTNRVAQVDPKRVAIEEEIKGRKSTSDKVRRKSISIERRKSAGNDWDFSTDNFPNWGDGYDRRSFSKLEKQNQEKDYEDETQRCKSVKGLRDHILSGSRMASAQGFASPTRQWSQPWPSRDHGSAACERTSKAQESRLQKEKVVEARGHNLKHLRK